MQDHFFFEEFDLLVVSFSLICCTVLFYELWGIVVPQVFGSENHQILLPTSTVGFGLLIVEMCYCMYVDGFSFINEKSLFNGFIYRKILFSIVKQAGSESYEMRYSLLVAIISSILCFFVVEIPESILNFGLQSGGYIEPI